MNWIDMFQMSNLKWLTNIFKKIQLQPGVTRHSCILSAWEVQAEEWRFKVSMGLMSPCFPPSFTQWYSISVAIRELCVKTLLDFYKILVKISVNKKTNKWTTTEKSTCWWENRGGKSVGCKLMWPQCGISSKNPRPPRTQQSLLGLYPKEKSQFRHWHSCVPMLFVELVMMAMLWHQPSDHQHIKKMFSVYMVESCSDKRKKVELKMTKQSKITQFHEESIPVICPLMCNLRGE